MRKSKRKESQDTDLISAAREGDIVELARRKEAGEDLAGWRGRSGKDPDGADPSVEIEGVSLLHLAAGSYEGALTVEFLLGVGADPGARDAEGGTPLHWAAREGSDPNAIDAEGRTAGHLAATHCDPEYLGILLDAGLDPRITDGEGARAEHYALGSTMGVSSREAGAKACGKALRARGKALVERARLEKAAKPGVGSKNRQRI